MGQAEKKMFDDGPREPESPVAHEARSKPAYQQSIEHSAQHSAQQTPQQTSIPPFQGVSSASSERANTRKVPIAEIVSLVFASSLLALSLAAAFSESGAAFFKLWLNVLVALMALAMASGNLLLYSTVMAIPVGLVLMAYGFWQRRKAVVVKGG